MVFKLIIAFIVVDCIALIIYFYDTMRLNFYFILCGVIVATLTFAAGYLEAKKKYGPK